MLKTRIKARKLRELTPLSGEVGHENARYMKPAMFKQLVENLRRDGCLTTLPLAARIVGEEPWYICSGNHRIAAAIEAGIEEADCIEIAEPLTRERFVAIQLAHNGFEGEDDPAALERLYGSLGLEFKEYSGLTDDAFQMDDLNVTTITGAAPMYAEMVFAFLSNDAAAVEAFIEAAQRHVRKGTPIYAADHADFERFFDELVRTKELKGITNSAIALRVMLELASERLDQLEKASEAA